MKRHLLYMITVAFACLINSSYSGGPAHNGLGNVTGGSGGTCANVGCHTTGTGTTNGVIEVRKKSLGPTSTPVSSYVTGETYIVTIVGSNATPGLDDFGFQFITEKSSDHTPVGTYSNLGAQVHGFPQSAPIYIEHSSAIGKTSGNYVVSFDWTAPATGVGQISMYTVINAVNNDGLSSGDKPSNTISLALADATSVAYVTSEVVVSIYPNPVADVLTIDLDKADAGAYTVLAYTSSGSQVSKTEMNIGPGNYAGSINTSAWAPGMYFIQLQKDGYKHVMPVVKQ